MKNGLHFKGFVRDVTVACLVLAGYVKNGTAYASQNTRCMEYYRPSIYRAMSHLFCFWRINPANQHTSARRRKHVKLHIDYWHRADVGPLSVCSAGRHHLWHRPDIRKLRSPDVDSRHRPDVWNLHHPNVGFGNQADDYSVQESIIIQHLTIFIVNLTFNTS
jgi:hypothetical protein